MVHHLPALVASLAPQVVTIRQADEPAHALRGSQAGLAEQLQGGDHRVVEARAPRARGPEAGDAAVDGLSARSLGRGGDHRLHGRPEADDAHEVAVTHLVVQDPLHALLAHLEARQGSSRIPRHHGGAPVQAEDHNFRRSRHHRGDPSIGQRLRRPRSSRDRHRPGNGRLLRPPHVSRLGRNSSHVQPRQASESLGHLLDAHPPVALADVHQALPGVGVLQDLRPLREHLLAKLVDAHSRVVERGGALDAACSLLVAPVEDRGHRLGGATCGQIGLVLLAEGLVVGRVQDTAVLPPSILTSSAAQELRPVPPRSWHGGRYEQEATVRVNVRIIHPVVRATTTTRICHSNPPSLPAQSRVPHGHRGPVQVLLPLLRVGLVERPR
mmetsp:Transcript_70788/g.191349  ORF Transcript_70788/g.191349 Transcript_70788/m.191349 type:complete len:383 (-) Transcript_70788:731-1879(-)